MRSGPDLPAATAGLRVQDDRAILSATERQQLETLAAQLQRATGAELGVLIVDTLGGADAHAYGVEVFNRWGLGQAGRNNGLLFVFAMRDRHVELIPGTGFKQLFDAAATARLLQHAVVPWMRLGQPATAVLTVAEDAAAMIRRPSRAAAPERTTVTVGDRNIAALMLAVVGLWTALSVALLAEGLLAGRRLLPHGWLLLGGPLVAGVAVAVVGRCGSWPGRRRALVLVVAGVALTAGLGSWIERHTCPRCGRWLRVNTLVTDTPTATRPGRELRTVTCPGGDWQATATRSLPAGPPTRDTGWGWNSGSSGGDSGGWSSGDSSSGGDSGGSSGDSGGSSGGDSGGSSDGGGGGGADW